MCPIKKFFSLFKKEKKVSDNIVVENVETVDENVAEEVAAEETVEEVVI